MANGIQFMRASLQSTSISQVDMIEVSTFVCQSKIDALISVSIIHEREAKCSWRNRTVSKSMKPQAYTNQRLLIGIPSALFGKHFVRTSPLGISTFICAISIHPATARIPQNVPGHGQSIIVWCRKSVAMAPTSIQSIQFIYSVQPKPSDLSNTNGEPAAIDVHTIRT